MRTRSTGPFVLPVRDIVRKPGEMREHSISTPASEQLGEGLIAVANGTEIDLDVRLESVHEGILASGDVNTLAEGECGRCLTPIAEQVEVEFQELFEYARSETSDYEVQDDHVDLETLIRDAIVLSLPFQPVCQPDCPGLDPVTGERLTSRAGGEQAVPVDPRWAALQAFQDESAPGSSGVQTEKS